MRGSYSCVFLRQRFTVSAPSTLGELELVVDYDDGFVAWINGIEMARDNVDGEPRFDDVASGSREAGSGVSFLLEGSAEDYLLVGENVIAIQALNASLAGSSDFRIDASLRAVQSVETPPFVVAQYPAPGEANNLQQIEVAFNETVVGLQPGDLLVNDVPVSGITPGAQGNSYLFTFSQPPAGVVHVRWSEGTQLTDTEGNPFDTEAPGSSWSYTLKDTTPPAILSQAPVSGARVGRLDRFEITFTEPITGLEAADLLIQGIPASVLTGSEAGPYLFTFEQPAPGTIAIQWAPNHSITDTASIPNAFVPPTLQLQLEPAWDPGLIRITETSSAGTSTFIDEDLEASDWIELHNSGVTPVSLLGWSLTDDPDNPGKWTFTDYVMSPGSYMVVFASGKDRRNPSAANRFHTNFKLNAFGEYLGLFSPELPWRPQAEFPAGLPEQRPDVSYGLSPSGDWAYYQSPSPGAANGGSSLLNIAPPPHASVPRGVFASPFQLTLTTSLPGAAVRYTTDGSEPTPNSPLADHPITISRTTTLRAKTFANGSLPSRSLTSTYIFLEDTINQPASPAGFPQNWGSNSGFPGGVIPADYGMDIDPLRSNPNDDSSPVDAAKRARLKQGLLDLPIVSVVLNQDDMFGQGGLYPSASDGNKTPNEKPCSVEMILPDGSTAFAIDAGIDLHGNASRNPLKNPKHGFKLTFKKDFGPAKLHYRLFPDSPAEEFDDLILRADFNSSWRHWSDAANNGSGAYQRSRGTRTRYAWAQETFRDMGHSSPHSLFFHLYINGLYWGTYDFGEQPTEHFAESSYGPSEDGFDIYDQGSLRNGTATAYNLLLGLTRLDDNSAYEQAKQLLDVPEFIDYMLLHFYLGHQDWGDNKNWYAVRPRIKGPQGTFRYIPWDQECILLEENVNRVPNAGGSTDVPSGLHTKLDDNTQYRLDFADRVFQHLLAPDGVLTPEANIQRWQKWLQHLDNAIVAESCRWGDYRRDVHPYSNGSYELYTREDHWTAENNRLLKSYFVNRGNIVLNQLRTAGLYPNVDAPVFSRQGGTVPAGFELAMTASSGTIYYTLNGADPRTYGSGELAAEALSYSGPIQLTTGAVVKARVRSGSTWSALNAASFSVGHLTPPLRITEIMYHHATGEACEFLELVNAGPIPIDISGASFEGIDLIFPDNTTMPTGAIWVLASSANPSSFLDCYPNAAVTGWFDGNLSNGGERIALLDREGITITAVHYDDEAGWPAEPDGNGPSLQIVDPFGDPNSPANWRASLSVGGTPGILEPPDVAPQVVLNEIMAENLGAVEHAGTYPDWLEIANRGNQEVDLAGWGLTDDSTPWKFTFPQESVIPAGGFRVVWCDNNTGASGLHTGFALSRKGDCLILHDASGQRIDGISFGMQLDDMSLGRISDTWTLAHPTPGTPNSPAALADSSVLHINEWMANPAPGGSDWIELYNASPDLPAAIQGLTVAAGPQRAPIQALAFIPANGFLQLFADEASAPNHLELRLPASGDTLQLYDPAGQLLQQLAYGAQQEAASQGRLPDGSDTIALFTESVSPGASNYLPSLSGPVISEIMARNQRSLVSPWGTTADWIEIHNPNQTALDLTGMTLELPNGNERNWMFPIGSHLQAGEYRVVWCDSSSPPATDSLADWNTGFDLSGTSATILLLSPQGQIADSVTHGFQVSDQSVGLSAGFWQLLLDPTPGGPNSAPASLGSIYALRINEWMAAPNSGEDWIEIYNPSPAPIDMAGLYLTDNPSLAGRTNTQVCPLSYIAPGGWVVWIADGNSSQGNNHAAFRLDQYGESILLYSADLNPIDSIAFGLQRPGVSEGRLLDGANSITRFQGSPSPGSANYQLITNVVINEVLTHTDPPLEDAVELLNLGDTPVDMGGWFLSDSPSDPQRYRIPFDTWIAPGDTLVFYQGQFGPVEGENDAPPLFSLNSAHGDSVILSQADVSGVLTGQRTFVAFGAAANGVSFGRVTTSTGSDFAALEARTFGQDSPVTLEEFRAGTGLPNSGPLVGPVVISEILFDSLDYPKSTHEFIELWNISDSTVTLFDPSFPENRWRLDGGISFAFPIGLTLPVGQTLVVVPFDPEREPDKLAAFQAANPGAAAIVGPYTGSLDDMGENIELLRPDTPQLGTAPDAGFVPLIVVERVHYGTLSPWPASPAAELTSLQRRVPAAYANDPASWIGAPPTAGLSAGHQQPAKPALNLFLSAADEVTLEFVARTGTSYSLLYSRSLGQDQWSAITHVAPPDSDQTMSIQHSMPAGQEGFYLLVTPARP